MRLLPCEWTESLYGNTQPESVLTRITSHRNWSVLRKNLLKPIIPVKCDAFRCWQQFPCYTPSDIIKYNSFLVTPRIKRSTLVTLSVFPVVGTIVAERKKGIPEDLPQMGNLSESLVFKAFYALLILDPWHQYYRLHMERQFRKSVWFLHLTFQRLSLELHPLSCTLNVYFISLFFRLSAQKGQRWGSNISFFL